MNHQHYLDAIETVLTWDLPDEALADAFHQQFTYIKFRNGDLDDQDSQLQ